MNQAIRNSHNIYMQRYRNITHKDIMSRRYNYVRSFGVDSIQASKMRYWSDDRIESYLIVNNLKT